MQKKSRYKFTLSGQTILVATVPFVVWIALTVLMIWLIRVQEAELSSAIATRRLLTESATLTDSIARAMISTTKYMTLTHSKDSLKTYFDARQEAQDVISFLEQHYSSDSREGRIAAKIEGQAQSFITGGDEAIHLVSLSGGTNYGVTRLTEIGEQIKEFPLDGMAQEFAELIDRQKSLSVSLDERLKTTIKLTVGLSMLLGIAVAFFTARYLSRNITGRLNIILENSGRLAQSKPLQTPVAGTDEVADLDEQFHAMVSFIERARRHERAIISNAGAVLFSLNEHREFSAVSPAATRLWACQPDQLIGKKFVDRLEGDCVAAVCAQLEPKPVGIVETEILWRLPSSNESRPFLVTSQWNESERTYYCSAVDTTALNAAAARVREAEQLVRSLVDGSPAAIMLADGDGKVTFANQAAAHSFGSKSELQGQRIQTLLSSGDSSASESAIKDLSSSEWKETTLPSGKSVQFLVRALSVHAQKTYIAVVLDISERQEIQSLRRQLVEAVSRDITTPLQSLRTTFNSVDVEASENVDEATLNGWRLASRECDRVSRLFADFVNFEQQELSPATLDKSQVDLSKIICDSADSVSGLAGEKGINIQCENLPAMTIMADAGRMQQVLINLLTNAIKFNAPHLPITIAAKVDGNQVQVSVSDNGPGIPDGQLEAIFQPFSQVTREDATVRGGTGLGLAIAKSIVENHAGTIKATNREPHGAQFVITLPLS